MILHLKRNEIPKGFLPLEGLFDKSDAFLGTNKPCADKRVIEVDIGSKETPRIVKIVSDCTPREKDKIM